MRLWHGRKTWDAAGSPRAVLYRIARNLAIDERRKRLIRRGKAGELSPDRRAPATPLEDLAASELERRLNAALARLPERDREIFLLSRHQRLSHAEIAEVLGLAQQTAANLLHGVLNRLRDELAPFLAPESETNVISFPRRRA